MSVEAPGRRLTAIVRGIATPDGRGSYRGKFVVDRDGGDFDEFIEHRHFVWTPEPEGTQRLSTLGRRKSTVMALYLGLRVSEVQGQTERAILYAIQSEADALIDALVLPGAWQTATSKIISLEHLDVRYEPAPGPAEETDGADDDAFVVVIRFRLLYWAC